MKAFLRSLGATMVVCLLIGFIGACFLPTAAVTEGSLSISIAEKVSARTILPTIDMNVDHYVVSGVGPGGATFSRTTSLELSVTVNKLAFGTWTVTVDAYNSGGVKIGSGTAEGYVHTSRTTTLYVTVAPLPGSGSLDLTVTWPALEVDGPSIAATLINKDSVAVPLDFSVTPAAGEGTWYSDTVNTGYYGLFVQLKDNDTPVIGAVEIVRIVKGELTAGTIAFPHVNKPGGTLVVNILPQMEDPIPISITGVPASFVAGSLVTATATVSDGTTGATYLWFLNSEYQTEGTDTFDLSMLPAAYYRLDIVAFTDDGRAGSGSVFFEVTETAP